MSKENKDSFFESNAKEEISIKDIISSVRRWSVYLRSKWKFICLTTIIFALIGFYISLSEKFSYKAVLTFALEEDKGGGVVGGLGGALSSFGIDLGSSGGGAFSSTNLIELMKSRLVVEKSLLKPTYIDGKLTNLAEYYIEINDLRKQWKKNPKIKNVHFYPVLKRENFNLQQDSILGLIYKSVVSKENFNIVQKDKKITITTIEVVSNSEIFSKKLCESIINETSSYYVEIKSKKSKQNVEILQKQADSIRQELNKSITGVATSIDKVYNLNPAFNIKKTPSTNSQVNVQFNTVILTQLLANLELAKVTLRKETPLIQVIDYPILPLEKNKIGKMKYTLIFISIGMFFSICSILVNKIIKQNI